MQFSYNAVLLGGEKRKERNVTRKSNIAVNLSFVMIVASESAITVRLILKLWKLCSCKWLGDCFMSAPMLIEHKLQNESNQDISFYSYSAVKG